MALGTWFLRKKGKYLLESNVDREQIVFTVGDEIFPNERYFKNDFILTKDKSLLYKKAAGDYSVFLGDNWRFELIVDSLTGCCQKIQCFLDELAVHCTTLDMPHAAKRALHITNSQPLSPAGGCHYFPFDDIVYWDSQKYLLCIGNPRNPGEIVEFTYKTFAVVDNGNLKCTYLVLDGLVGQNIF